MKSDPPVLFRSPISIPRWKLAILSAVGVLMATTLIQGVIGRLAEGKILPFETDVLSAVLDAVSVGALAVVVLSWLGVRRKQSGTRLGRRYTLLLTADVAALSVTISMLIFLAPERFGIKEEPSFVILRSTHGTNLLLFLIAIVVIGPMSEELLFRGLVYNAIVTCSSPVIAAIISSAFFALAHLNLILFVPIFCVSLLLTYLYQRSGSLYPSMIVHGLVNASTAVEIMLRVNNR